MNCFRKLALAAVMAMTAMPGMAQEVAKKVCVVTGVVEGTTPGYVIINRKDEEYRYQGSKVEVAGGRFKHEMEADGISAYVVNVRINGHGRYADFFADGDTVELFFPKKGVGYVRPTTPLNAEMRRVVDATDTIPDAAVGRLRALESAKLDYAVPARRLVELRDVTKDSDSLKTINDSLDKLQAEGRLLTPEFVAANNAVDEACRRMFKVRCSYAVEHPGPVGLYFLQQAVWSQFADTALIRKAVTEIYAPKYPTAYATRWLQGWLVGCNAKVGGRYFDFTAPDLDGNDHTLSEEIAGRVALIDLWGSWCGPCRHHSKALIPVYDKYKDLSLIHI